MRARGKKHNFTKADLIESLSQQHRITKVLSAMAVNSVLDSITRALRQGNRVEIRGFGSFEVRKYRSYQGRNPYTGEKVQVKSKKRPFFKMGKIKNKINNSRLRK